MKSLIYFSLLFILSLTPKEQELTDFEVKQIPLKYLPNQKKLNIYISNYEKTKLNCIDVTNFLPSNYVKDATRDYTKIIQRAIDQYDKIIFPDFPVLINKKGLTLKSNSIILFPKNSKLIFEGNNLEIYEILRLHQVNNVILYFPKIQGDRNNHLGTSGEWGMGISLRGAKNIQLINPQISDCFGDGIFISHWKTECKNIFIDYAVINNNRRNGISVCSVDSLNLTNSIVANTNGTRPETGIDIEPDHENEFIKNINIKNIITFNNNLNGFLIALNKLKIIDENSNIKVENYTDDSSNYSFRMEFTPHLNSKKKVNIQFKNTLFINTKINQLNSFNTNKNIKINFDKLKVIDSNKINLKKKQNFLSKIKNL